ncbi:MAG: hydratase, partial [Variovorax sp.]
MTDDAIKAAAEHLLALRRAATSGARLPPLLRPDSVEAGWRIQQRVTASLAAQPGGGVAGWKCGLPDGDKLFVAPIYVDGMIDADADAEAERARIERVEPEFAFLLASDLPARDAPYSIHEIDRAIGNTHLALEVLGSRVAKTEEPLAFAELLADGLMQRAMVLGPVASETRREPTFQLQIEIDGQPPEVREARHPNGDPRQPLYWLVEFLRAR